MPERHSEAGSNELQATVDRLSERLNVSPMPVGLRTNDGLNIYVADGTHHFAFYERGTLAFDQAGSLDDVLYWYCESVVTRQAAKLVGDRAERFKYEYQVLSQFDVGWAKRRVRELAAMFANGQPEDIAFTSGYRRRPLTAPARKVRWPSNDVEREFQHQRSNGAVSVRVLPGGFDSVEQLANAQRQSHSALEINFLKENAAVCGYEQQGNMWVYVGR